MSITIQDKYASIPDKKVIDDTINALKNNNINAMFANSDEEVKQLVAKLIPEGSEVMTMTSVTLEEIGIRQILVESGKYDSVRKKLLSMNSKTQGKEMRKLGGVPDYAIGSVHAVTEDGKLIIASQGGSQIPAYAYGASTVVFVVGVQKIVKNIDEGFKRIEEHSLPMESVRAQKAYGVPGSSINELLIINKAAKPGRLNVILINKVIGF